MIQLTNNLFCIEVPQDARDFVIDGEFFYKAPFSIFKNVARMVYLPQGEWQIIGSISKDTCDFDCAEVLDAEPPADIEMRELIEIKSQKFFKNPLGDCIIFNKYMGFTESSFDKDAYEKDLQAWREAENNLIKKIVIIKNNI